jgi:chromosome segregation ATPase
MTVRTWYLGYSSQGLRAPMEKYYKEITVPQGFKYIPRIAIFLAGIAAGALTGGSRRGRDQADPAVDALKKSVSDLESRLAAHETATVARFEQVDEQVREHAARLADVPSTSQIITAMEQLLSKTMSSLDERLTTQARSIEVLKTTVSQTDSLLERVLESLDSLQAGSDSPDAEEDSLLERPAV